MELTPKQQAVELIKGADHILILAHKNPDGDAIGSLLALGSALSKMGKNTHLVAEGVLANNLQFLPGFNLLNNSLSVSRDFIITIDTTVTRVEKILYKKEGENKLNIFLTPGEQSVIKPEQISFVDGSFPWQLIIVLDCADLSRVGTIQEENADLFYALPIINIDHHAGNDYFGKVNLIDMTATSTAEVLVSLLESLGREKSLFDEDIATNLLTGIISDTGSFQNSNTTPKSFTVAAQLVASGARQQEIIRQLFKTKALSTLRVWGRALTNLHDEKDLRFAWSSVNEEEINAAEASPEETSGVIDELLKSATDVDFVLLLSDRNSAVHGSLRASHKNIDVSKIAEIFGGGGHPAAASFELSNSSLATTQSDIIHKIRQFQTKQFRGENQLDAKVQIDQK